MTYPPRLIEVDLPIRAISAHARREKSIRHGHISTLHIWWARRPLAALLDRATTLDRLHQAMLLFSSNRGEALRCFWVEEGAGKDQRFWRLAQALSALYPSGSQEKRWVDGVLARKKGLGF